jgi:hypothetical protein
MIIAGAHPCNINLNNLDFNFANYVGFENKAFLVTKRRFYIYLAAKCTFTFIFLRLRTAHAAHNVSAITLAF